MPKQVKRNDEEATEEYLDTLSKVGQELFSDFLSDNSRNRQNYLLISSIFTILLAFTLISPGQTDIGGLIFSFTDPDIPLILASLICLYFLFVYGICVLQDWQVYKFRTLPSFRVIRKKLIQSLDSMARQPSKKSQDDSFGGSNKSFINIKAAHEKKIAVINGKIQKLLNENKSLENSAFASDESSIRKIASNKRRVATLQDDKDREVQNFNNLLASLNSRDSTNVSVVQTARESSELLRSVDGKYRMYNIVIVVLEVLFPIILALVALFVTIKKLF